jgi:hypothetical protein
VTSRFLRYLRWLVRVAILLAAIFLVLFALQSWTGLLTAPLEAARAAVAGANDRLSDEAFAGISVGSLALVLALCLLPLFLKKIDERAYLRGLWRGIVATGVFFLSNALYAFAEKISRLYLLGAIAIVIVATALLVEGVSLAVREEEERSFRTDIASSSSRATAWIT